MLTPDYGVNLILIKAALYIIRLQTSVLNAKDRIIFLTLKKKSQETNLFAMVTMPQYAQQL